MNNLDFSVLGSRFSVLGSRFSVLGSRFSVLGSRFSVLGSRFSVLLAFVYSFTLNPANAQNETCGTPDLPWPQYQELLDGRGPGPYVSGAQNYDLPIWINLVSPETPGLGWLSLFDPLAMVASLNGYFASSSAGIQFHLCGVSYLYSDALVHLDLNSEQDSLRNLAASQNPNYDNVINVNLVNSLTGGFKFQMQQI